MSSFSRKVILGFAIALLISAPIFVIKTLNQPKIILPPDFPKTPVPENTKLIDSNKNPQEAVLYNAKWESKDSVPEVSAHYIEKLQNEGWTLDVPPADLKNEDIQYAVFFNEKYTLNVSFIRNLSNSKTEVITEYLPNLKANEKVNPDPQGSFPGGKPEPDNSGI